MFQQIHDVFYIDAGLEESILGSVFCEYVAVFLTIAVVSLPLIIAVAILYRCLRR